MGGGIGIAGALPIGIGEMDAYGVRGFGSVMSASKLAVATLALHAFAKTCTSFQFVISLIGISEIAKTFVSLMFCPSGLPATLLQVKASRVAFHFVPRRGSRAHDYVVISRSRIIQIKRKPPRRVVFLFIGIARFELTTSCSRSKRSTRLSYIPVWWSNYS